MMISMRKNLARNTRLKILRFLRLILNFAIADELWFLIDKKVIYKGVIE